MPEKGQVYGRNERKVGIFFHFPVKANAVIKDSY